MKQFRNNRLLRGLIGCVLLFQFVLMLAMSASDKLHHDLHCDGDHHDHTCEVTLFHSGALDHSLPMPASVVEVETLALPDVLPPGVPVEIAATHLRGGVLAHSPPRGP